MEAEQKYSGSGLADAIRIVPVGEVDRELLEYLALVLPGRFGGACAVTAPIADFQVAYDARRKQYHSTQLLVKLSEHGVVEGIKTLGLTEHDLFIPIFTYVFGEAQVGGCVALVSTHRLSQQFYGFPEDRKLLFTRAEKEATHELGHTYGLAHCQSYDCVMRFSNSVEDVDLRAGEFCELCEVEFARTHSILAA